jgi:hypothetical protein
MKVLSASSNDITNSKQDWLAEKEESINRFEEAKERKTDRERETERDRDRERRREVKR